MGNAVNPAHAAACRITCDVLTGFLGSGKTTLLNRFLHTEAAQGVAVVINEIGAIGIDQLILSQISENVVLLESGCLCCSLSGSLRETLLDLKRQARTAGHPLARVVIETTGLAEPAPILNILLGDRMLADSFVLGRVVSAVDAHQALGQIRQQRETVRQVALADVLAITKTDLVDKQSELALSTALDGLNTTARRVRASDTDALTDIFMRAVPSLPARSELGSVPMETGHERHPHSHAAHPHGTVNTESLWLGPQRIHPAGLAAWMHLLTCEYGDRLLRCKGLLHLSDPIRDVFVQGVGRYFHPLTAVAHWPDSDPRARMVVIGEQIDPSWLHASLRAFVIDEAGLLPRTLEELNQVVHSTSDHLHPM